METTMKTGDFIEGLNIILPFYTKGRDGYNLGADEVQTGSDYDPAEGWAVYV
jgi:hypothetical protein